MMKKFIVALTVSVGLVTAAHAGLDTQTYVSNDGNGSGSVSGDTTGVGEVTLMDVQGGDMWNGGDQFMYLHDSQEKSTSFTATVRVVSQTAAVDGQWGKAGIVAKSSLDGFSSFAMAQVAAGNGSQGAVPVRLGGRTTNDGNNNFEDPVFHNPLSTLNANVEGHVVNDMLPNTPDLPSLASPAVWLSLEYNAGSNGFTAGVAADIGGAPGVWNYSDMKTDIASDGDWVIGLGYSAHSDLQIGPGQVNEQPDSMHGITFDNYSFSAVPEPSSLALFGLALCGLLGLRRRR